MYIYVYMYTVYLLNFAYNHNAVQIKLKCKMLMNFFIESEPYMLQPGGYTARHQIMLALQADNRMKTCCFKNVHILPANLSFKLRVVQMHLSR